MRPILLSALMLLTACSTSKDAATGTTPTTKDSAPVPKPGAPTELESAVSGNTVKLSLKFLGEGKNVSASVTGIDGVAVSAGSEWLSSVSVASGEVRTQDVTFAATARGHLVVSVSGEFGGAKRSRVHTVAVGEGGVKKDLGKVQQTSDGDTVKVME